MAATTGLTLLYFFSSSVQGLAKRLGPYGLAGLHVWRVPAALTFFWYGAVGALPGIFVTLAGWGDLFAGLAALAVVVLPRNRKTISAFHVFGLGDFLVAVGTGLTLTQFEIPEMATITRLPVALIPLVGVPLSGATHIAALHMLFAKHQGVPA